MDHFFQSDSSTNHYKLSKNYTMVVMYKPQTEQNDRHRQSETLWNKPTMLIGIISRLSGAWDIVLCVHENSFSTRGLPCYLGIVKCLWFYNVARLYINAEMIDFLEWKIVTRYGNRLSEAVKMLSLKFLSIDDLSLTILFLLVCDQYNMVQ